MTEQTISIRMAKESDAEVLLSIYAPYVLETAITFEYTVPTLEEFKERICHTLSRYPYLVAEINGVMVGYAYASPFKSRAAYDWSVETSIYIDMEYRGQGIGNRLLPALEEILKKQNILNANACIAYPNPGSIAFHKRHGYHTVGHFTACGYKMGIWYDMVWMEKMLGEHPETPEAVISVGDL